MPDLLEDRTAAATLTLRLGPLTGGLLPLVIHPLLNVWRVPPRADTLCSIRLAALLAAFTRSSQHAGNDAYGSETVLVQLADAFLWPLRLNTGSCVYVEKKIVNGAYLSSLPGMTYVTCVGSASVSMSPMDGMFSCAHSCSMV